MIAVASMIAIAERVRECRVQGATARVDTDTDSAQPHHDKLFTLASKGEDGLYPFPA